MEQAIIALVGVVIGGLISFLVAWQNARWTAQREERLERRKQQENLTKEMEALYSQSFGQGLHRLSRIRISSVMQLRNSIHL